jgi:hypothetical protein
MAGSSLTLVVLSGILVGRSVAAADYFPPLRVGTIPPLGTNEISGMIRASGRSDRFWVHNDGSDPTPRIFAIEQSGQLIAELAIAGATNGDWEDIAVGPGGDPPVRSLFIADVGTNLAPRAVVSIWRVSEPDLDSVAPGARLTSEPAEELRIRYPGGAVRDAEGLVVDPADGELHLFTREAGTVRVFRVPAAPDADGIYTLASVGSLPVTTLATGADLSPDGASLLLRTYAEVLLYERAPGAPFKDFLAGRPQSLPAPVEVQGESISWDQAGLDYLTTSEGASAPIYRVFRKVPRAACSMEVPADSPLRFVRGDLAREAGSPPDVAVDVTDAVALMDVLSGAPASCRSAGDVDDDGDVDRADLNRLLAALAYGRSIPMPFPDAGLDPSLDLLSCGEQGSEELVPEGAEWAFWYAAEPPPEDWMDPAAPPPSWPRGKGGVGFGRSGLGTVVAGAPSLSPALYGRLEFTAGPSGPSQQLALEVDCAHGFVASLNGVEVARRGLPEPGFGVPREMPASLHLGGAFEGFLICKDLLSEGTNVLAIEAHNTFPVNSRLCFRVRLRRFDVVPRSDPPAPPAIEDPPRLLVETSQPLEPGGEGVLSVVLESAEAVRGASWVLEHDANLQFPAGKAGESLGPGAVTVLAIDPLKRQVAQAFVAGPPPGAIPPGRLVLASLSCRVLAANAGVARLSFIRRAGLGSIPGLACRVTGEDGRSIAPLSGTVELAIAGAPFIRGDLDGGGAIDLADAIGILGWLFLRAGAPACAAAADANADGAADLGDALSLLFFLFLDGAPPPMPFPDCGSGSAVDEELGCGTAPGCP